ncbi:MAG: arsenosugar biosynthesis radical SAM protein ArsS [Deltaproteobacteria bacterium]|nr:arsenosugar biosynthesis radical SAM protein ArsS [Deltaproteobacteria bacterium]
MVNFLEKIKKENIILKRYSTEILQINVGKFCNQACHHCHVEAGPKRTEIMEQKTVDRILELLKKSLFIHTVDMTGGAPELNPHFRYLILECRKLNKILIDRCNLTVLLEQGQEDLVEFLKENRVQVIASLPCYSKDNVDEQRGKGVFDKSIKALQVLNEAGYGVVPHLKLHLVYNPLGTFLPPPQEKLKSQYKKELKTLFDIDFNDLYTITNMPIKRFYEDLRRKGELETYMKLLESNFNSQAAEMIMCRNLISIGWDGKIYDCDFNQMLDIPLGGQDKTIWNIESFDDISDSIAFDNHCYGCTAGAGSSCSGALT